MKSAFCILLFLFFGAFSLFTYAQSDDDAFFNSLGEDEQEELSVDCDALLEDIFDFLYNLNVSLPAHMSAVNKSTLILKQMKENISNGVELSQMSQSLEQHLEDAKITQDLQKKNFNLFQQQSLKIKEQIRECF